METLPTCGLNLKNTVKLLLGHGIDGYHVHFVFKLSLVQSYVEIRRKCGGN